MQDDYGRSFSAEVSAGETVHFNSNHRHSIQNKGPTPSLILVVRPQDGTASSSNVRQRPVRATGVDPKRRA
jgi:hypothetical protein